MPKTLITSGEGYEEVTDGEERMYLHRLTAAAEFGLEALNPENDVHHKEMWDGRSIPFLNARDWLEPEGKWEHRKGHLGLTD